MKIKICGLTNAQNAKEVANTGVDAIGLVFYEKSTRVVDIHQAHKIIQSLPPFINRVGLFVNHSSSYITEVINTVAIDTLQFHGNETPEECEKYNMPFIKAIRVNKTINLAKIADCYQNACGLLLDSDSKDYGGTGKTFDWHLITTINQPIILAGGLNANNIASAIQQVNPYAVDVSSGVESAKGIKDITKVAQFLKNIN